MSNKSPKLQNNWKLREPDFTEAADIYFEKLEHVICSLLFAGLDSIDFETKKLIADIINAFQQTKVNFAKEKVGKISSEKIFERINSELENLQMNCQQAHLSEFLRIFIESLSGYSGYSISQESPQNNFQILKDLVDELFEDSSKNSQSPTAEIQREIADIGKRIDDLQKVILQKILAISAQANELQLAKRKSSQKDVGADHEWAQNCPQITKKEAITISLENMKIILNLIEGSIENVANRIDILRAALFASLENPHDIFSIEKLESQITALIELQNNNTAALPIMKNRYEEILVAHANLHADDKKIQDLESSILSLQNDIQLTEQLMASLEDQKSQLESKLVVVDWES